MIETKRCFGAMVTAPHDLAARAGLRVLDENGTCLEAMVAAAATIAVTYPHMNGLGGDNFWLISVPGERAKGIDACGAETRHRCRSREILSADPRPFIRSHAN